MQHLENELAVFRAEDKLNKMILLNSAVIQQTIASFFTQLLCEIHELGFDLLKVRLMREVLNDHHMGLLDDQIKEIERTQEVIQRPIASLKCLYDFRDVLTYLRG